LNVLQSHGLRFCDSTFWVTHRRREYGPFDYEWSKDLCGIELTYQGRKFGEYCSDDEIFADLKEFRLPAGVAAVGSIVLGCIIFRMLHGLEPSEFDGLVIERLRAAGWEKYSHFRHGNDAA
jgi:hypothetical protein